MEEEGISGGGLGVNGWEKQYWLEYHSGAGCETGTGRNVLVILAVLFVILVLAAIY